MSEPVTVLRLAVDLDELKRNIAEGKHQVEALGPSMAKIVAAWAGHSAALVQDAHNITAAVQQVGASTLTAGSASSALKTLEAAMAQLRATSQPVPPLMAQTAAELQKLHPSARVAASATEGLTGAIGKQVTAWATGLVSIYAAQRALRGVTDFLISSVEEYTKAEASAKKLTTALQAQGNATPAVIGHFKDLQETFQRTTVYEDDLIAEMQALLVQVGDVAPDQMRLALEAATNLASGLGIDLRAAILMVAKASEENVTALRKAGVMVDEHRAKAEGLGYVLGVVNEKFGGQAAAEIETYGGKVKQLANEWGNLKEAVGGVILSTNLLPEALEKVVAQIRGISTAIKDLNENLPGSIAGLLLASMQGTNGLLDLLERLGQAKRTADIELIPPMEGPTRPPGWEAAQKKAQEAAEKAAKKHAEALAEIASATVSLTANEAALVDQWNKSEVSLGAMAEALGVTEVQIRKYLAAGEKARELQEGIAKITLEVNAILAKNAWAQLAKDLEEANTAFDKAINAHQKLLDESLKQTEKAESGSLEKRLGWLEWEYAKRKAALDKNSLFYQRDLELLTKLHQAAAADVVDSWTWAGQKTTTELIGIAEMAKYKFERLVAAGMFPKAIVDQARTDWKAAAAAIEGDWRDSLGDIADVIASVFSHINSQIGQLAQIVGHGVQQIVKEGVTGAKQFVAAMVTIAAVVGEVGSAWTGTWASVTKAAVAGAASGAAIGMWWGGVGAGIGAAIGAVSSAIMAYTNAMASGDAANAAATVRIKDLEAALIKQYGSMANIATIGKVLGIDLAGAWGDQSRAGLEHFTQLMDQFQTKMQTLQGALDTYGLSWKDLGDDMKKMSFGQQAFKLYVDFGTMKAAGVDPDKAIKGMSGALSQLVIDAIDTGQKIPAALQPIIEKLIRMGGLTDAAAAKMLGITVPSELMPSLADITAAADRYGISLDELGPKVQQLQITELANQYVADWKILTAATDDWGVLFDKIGPKVQDLVTKAMKYGSELPASMRPMIQSFVDAGELVDENGEKLTDLSQLTFAADLSAMFETLIGKLDELIDKIVKGVVPSLTDIGKTNIAPIKIPFYYEDTSERDGGSDKGGGRHRDEDRGLLMHRGGLIAAQYVGASLWPAGEAYARAHTGLLVGPAVRAADEVAILAQVGEGLLSRDVGMPALGRWALQAMNAGQGPGGAGVDEDKLATAIARAMVTAGAGGGLTFNATFTAAQKERYIRDEIIPGILEVFRQGGAVPQDFRVALRVQP